MQARMQARRQARTCAPTKTPSSFSSHLVTPLNSYLFGFCEKKGNPFFSGHQTPPVFLWSSHSSRLSLAIKLRPPFSSHPTLAVSLRPSNSGQYAPLSNSGHLSPAISLSLVARAIKLRQSFSGDLFLGLSGLPFEAMSDSLSY